MRPEVLKFVERWAETGISGALALGLCWTGGVALSNGGWLGWFIIAAGLAAALWCRAAWVRARMSRHGDGPGMVVIEERRIGYYGPYGGGFVDVDALDSVSLRPGDGWVLTPAEGVPLIIPAAAAGADGLADALTALPGFRADRAAEALSGGRDGLLTIWRRPSPALAHRSPGA